MTKLLEIMFGKIRSKIGKYYFMKEKQRGAQHRRLTNLQDARHIGIIYALNDVPTMTGFQSSFPSFSANTKR